MSICADKRHGIVLGLAAICLLPLHFITAVSTAPLTGQGIDCGSALQGADRLTADLGLDGGLANRAGALADAAARAGQPPSPDQLGSLVNDSLEGMNDAADRIDEAADQIGQRLESLKLTRQGRVWSEGVKNMRSARGNLRSAIRKEPNLGRKGAGSLSAAGVGPTTTYEAADSFQHSVDSLGSIADQSNFQEIGQRNWIEQGKPDMAPPPNPLPDPLQEALRRLRAQQMRIQNNVNGLNAARAMQARQFAQAQRNTADMQRAVKDARNFSNQLGQVLGPCNQPTQQSQRQNARTNGGQQNAANAGTAAASGGGHTGAIVGLGLAGAGAVGGYAAYKAMYPCGTGPNMTNYNSCVEGLNADACLTWLEAADPFCQCVEEHETSVPAGTCTELLDAVRETQRYCRSIGGC